MLAHNVPDGTAGFKGFSKVSKLINFQQMEGGYAGYPPTPMQGGYDRFETQKGRGSVADPSALDGENLRSTIEE
jgi:hypothetical protein